MAQLPLNELLAVFLDATHPEKLSTDEAMSVLASALVARGQVAGLSLNEVVAGVADTYREASRDNAAATAKARKLLARWTQ